MAHFLKYAPGGYSLKDSISEKTIKPGALLIAQIHGYLFNIMGLKSIKTLIVELKIFFNLLAIISTILIINLR
jgi:hypothetical protein